jgi:glucose/arabinose dehydrogenase
MKWRFYPNQVAAARIAAAALLGVTGLTGCGGEGPAAPSPTCDAVQGTPALRLERVVDGLERPLDLKAPVGDDRLFVAEQAGRIRIVRNGALLPTPFLDIVARVQRQGEEQGLLGIAFHPRYATNGRFFVHYTDREANSHVSEFVVSSDRDRADPASERELLFVEQPFGSHKGGGLAFGRDGYLYASLGDGGGSADPTRNGQRVDTLLAKLLRIDVDGARPYAIPPDNPFRGQEGARPEIWHYGLRNPWRFAFDDVTGDLFIADVGASRREEVDYARAGHAGINFGWNTMEGSLCFRPVTGCPTQGLTLPLVEYPRAEGCSIIGGVVYRGCRMPGYHGTYFYSDYCSAFLRTLRVQDGRVAEQRDLTTSLGGLVGSPSAFGTDGQGEMYIVDLEGVVFRIVPSS